MKALIFCILPLVALVIVSFVIGIKEKQITRVVEETEVMQHSIRTAGTAAEYTLEGSGLGQHRSRALVEQGGRLQRGLLVRLLQFVQVALQLGESSLAKISHFDHLGW